MYNDVAGVNVVPIENNAFITPVWSTLHGNSNLYVFIKMYDLKFIVKVC